MLPRHARAASLLCAVRPARWQPDIAITRCGSRHAGVRGVSIELVVAIRGQNAVAELAQHFEFTRTRSRNGKAQFQDESHCKE
jgi:hypothetical protein